MRKQIYIAPNGTIGIDDYFELDLIEEARLPITYQIADIREPDKRKTTHSKTITLPGTANNNKIFGNIFEIGIDGSFNQNIKSECVLLSDTELVFSGFLLLKKVIIKGQIGIDYEAEIYGELKNIFTNLSDKKLSDLDLSEYDHEYRKQVVEDSWTAKVVINGTPTQLTLGTDNEGYVYPLIDYGLANLSTETFYVEQFFPAIFIRTLLDKIFKFAGFTWQSDFLDSAFFRKKIYIDTKNTDKKISTSEKLNQEFSANINGTQAQDVRMDIGHDSDTLLSFSNEISDAGGRWSVDTFTCNKKGFYTFNGGVLVEMSSQHISDVTVTCKIFCKKNGAGQFGLNSVTHILSFNQEEEEHVDLIPFTVFLDIGDTIKFYARREGDDFAGIDVNINDNITFDPIPYFNNSFDDKIFSEGQQIIINDILNKDLKVTDFFIWLIKMFNLYVFPDKDDPKKLLIEPRDKVTVGAETFGGFYTGIVLDWSDKLDSELIELELTNELAAKNYLFTYEEDSDYYNQKYKKSWFNALGKNSIYGEKVIENNNDFLKNTKETKIGFAPTPSADSVNTTQRIIPAIFKANEDGTGRATMASKPRILTYQGLRALTADDWTFVSALDGNSAESSYPYAGHLDDPQNPTFDLNFGLVREVFYTDTDGVLTNNNLYELFHKTFIEQIIDKDAKILVGKFRLTTKDIRELDFRKTIFCAGAYFLINKISDFDLDSDELASVELIKIK